MKNKMKHKKTPLALQLQNGNQMLIGNE